MIRKASADDISTVAALYEKAIDYEDTHIKYTSWQKGIYPTADTARLGIKNDSLYVCEENGHLIASVILDNKQPPEYKKIKWQIDSTDKKALVIHTLCVDPDSAGSGVGTAIVDFAKNLAKELGYTSVRLNTTARNSLAIHLYEKNGFSVVATQKILLNGQIHCGEHLFMEYAVT